MWKALLFPLVILAVLFTPAIIIALNVGAIIGLVAYLIYSGIKKITHHHHYASHKAA